MVAPVMSKCDPISPADIRLDFNILSMSRRTGSARALIVFCNPTLSPHLTFNLIVKCIISRPLTFVNSHEEISLNFPFTHRVFKYSSHKRVIIIMYRESTGADKGLHVIPSARTDKLPALCALYRIKVRRSDQPSDIYFTDDLSRLTLSALRGIIRC